MVFEQHEQQNTEEDDYPNSGEPQASPSVRLLVFFRALFVDYHLLTLTSFTICPWMRVGSGAMPVAQHS
jgi:hypothetical protein